MGTWSRAGRRELEVRAGGRAEDWIGKEDSGGRCCDAPGLPIRAICLSKVAVCDRVLVFLCLRECPTGCLEEGHLSCLSEEVGAGGCMQTQPAASATRRSRRCRPASTRPRVRSLTRANPAGRRPSRVTSDCQKSPAVAVATLVPKTSAPPPAPVRAHVARPLLERPASPCAG